MAQYLQNTSVAGKTVNITLQPPGGSIPDDVGQAMAYNLTQPQVSMVRKTIYYLTHWEVWHWFAKYIIIGPAWLWFCLRGRSLWFFTPSNPSIVFGGFIGESKSEIYRQLPVSTYPLSILVAPNTAFDAVVKEIHQKKLSFPLAVKPDVGMMGFMFRKVNSLGELKQYHEAMPVQYILQEYVSHPLEVSVFYYRFPGETKGHITGFIKKEFLQVTGDGKKNLETLIREYPRARFRQKEMFSKHESHLKAVIPNGQTYCLSHALNLSRGGRLVSLEQEKDERLVALFDKLSNHSGKFFYGRYDIKCSSIEELKQGKNFSILEYNGCGAEPHHVYGNGLSFLKACEILIGHWRILLIISNMNRAVGIAPWGFKDGLRFSVAARQHFKILKELDLSFEFNTAQSSDSRELTKIPVEYERPLPATSNG